MIHDRTPPGQIRDFRDRRRTPRIEISGQVHGEIVSLGVPVHVLEIGLGGCGIVTACTLPLNTVQELLFTLVDGTSVSIRARVAHCRPRLAPDSPSGYVTGLEFVDEPSADGQSAAGILVDRITSVLSFDIV
jgi:hypothetical protein